MVQTSQASAQETDSKVSTNFQANDFGVWSNSSLYGQIYNGSTELAKWTQLWCTGWDDPTCANYSQLYEDLILRTCKIDTDRSCIDSLQVNNSNGQLEKLMYYGESKSKIIPPFIFKATKLTPEIVETIRKSPLTQRALAAQYGVAPSNISRIIAGETW